MLDLKIYQEERPWGVFRQFIHNEPCTVKIITVKPKQFLSLQSHNKRSEFWRIVGGSGKVQIGENIFTVKKDDEYNIPVNTKHRLMGGDSVLEVLEISIGDFDENDIIRYEDKYGRK